MVKILLGNVSCKVIGLTDVDVIRDLDEKMSYKFSGYQFMSGGRGGYKMSGKYGGWDGVFRLFTKRKSFPAGLLYIAEEVFKKNGIEYSTIDSRPPIKLGKPLDIIDEDFSPRDYQLDIVKKSLLKGGGIIRSATGSGKTSCIAMLAAKYNIPTVIYVIGIELLYQMKDTIERLYGVECGIVGGGKCDTSKNITIMTIWSAASAFNKKCKIIDNDLTLDSAKMNKALNKSLVRKVVTESQLVIVDECQYAASETVQFLHKASESARYRFLFSGTPWRDTGDDILINAVGGPKIYDLNATKLIKENYLVYPEIHFMNVPVMRGVGKTYQEVYRNYIVENPERNNMITKCTKKLVESGKKVLILVVRVGHGNSLMELMQDELSIDFLDGKKNATQRLDAIKKMKSGELDVLIASKIFDQGVDIPELDALVLAGSGKSSGRALQRIGRVIRTHPGKKKAIVVEFFDNCKYLRDHSEKRIEVYSSEPAFKIIMPKNKVLHKYPKKKPITWA
jgi:superfamily II DNA or RNA helicase|tara:strand:- start:9816 stop:11336 length:1521 start_codon:yes stop_codon:yes gene_type:complete